MDYSIVNSEASVPNDQAASPNSSRKHGPSGSCKPAPSISKSVTAAAKSSKPLTRGTDAKRANASATEFREKDGAQSRTLHFQTNSLAR